MPPAPAAPRRPLSLFGVQIRIHVSWVIVALFIAWSLASGSLPMLFAGLPAGSYWSMAGIIVIGLAASIVLHELAHALVGRAMGISVDRITLFLFGGVAELHEEPKRPGGELAMAIAGPAFSAVFSLVLAAAAGAVGQTGAPTEVVMALGYLATLNLVLAAFNMAPAFPLDGGRVLRALLWMSTHDLMKATRIAVRTSEVLALLLMAAGLTAAFTVEAAGGLWWIMIGLFLHGAARGALRESEARQMFAGHAIAEVMAPSIETVPAAYTLDRFVDERLMASRHGLYPVMDGETWLGIVKPEDILRTPREAWKTTTMGEICTPAAATPVAGLLDDASLVMDRMRTQQVQRMPVVHRGSVVGIVTLQDLMGSLELWRRFRPKPL
ncbi:MAG: site-2 protease family protein [Phenylobacterium sp.]|uniref:site-2 protease family protein n=1 Tax=Phenylobacterium sp. TaxID=1871053 RepID=UPI00121FFC6C|nr:site-2 protease family protein [Phenylobacterium sp.]TAJ69839.1 MAG: site-2 protease family protein [Phenylobacterium sp.]